jgi:gliding motility-associated-like protein
MIDTKTSASPSRKLVSRVHHSLFTVHCSLFTVHCSLFFLLFFLPGQQSYSQFSAGIDDTINPGVPVTLTASYGLTGTEVTTTDDGVEGPFPIGFSFSFYGQTYTQFYIGANGWISFSADKQANARNAFLIPGTSAETYNPKICILGPFQDYDPSIAGGPYIFYRTVGEEPARKLVVMWCQAHMRWCQQKYVTFQIVLSESDSTIENHILSKPACYDYDSNYATQGIRNAYKVVGTAVPGRNRKSWSVDENHPEGWKYTPVNQDTYTVDTIPYILEPLSPGNKINYRWYEGETFLTDQQSIVVAPKQTTTYRAYCTICNGQEFTDEVTVYVIPYIPNAFTPDGDGLNDRFRITGLPPENITAFNMQIYNRWGQMVFSTNDILEAWDGKSKGEVCPEGIYTWVIYYIDNRKTRVSNKGSIMIVR